MSIQGLILVPEPYYNEPSYDQYRGTEEGNLASKQYNESALLLTLESILRSSRSPPPHFAALVSHHYAQVKVEILEACRASLDEAKAASQTEAGAASLGFSLSLDKMITRLERELAKHDAAADAAGASNGAGPAQ